MKLFMVQTTLCYFKTKLRFLIQLLCYPKTFNNKWKCQILDLHCNSSSNDGARFLLAVQLLQSSVLLYILILCNATLDDCLSSSTCSRIFSSDIPYFDSCFHATNTRAQLFPQPFALWDWSTVFFSLQCA